MELPVEGAPAPTSIWLHVRPYHDLWPRKQWDLRTQSLLLFLHVSCLFVCLFVCWSCFNVMIRCLLSSSANWKIMIIWETTFLSKTWKFIYCHTIITLFTITRTNQAKLYWDIISVYCGNCTEPVEWTLYRLFKR